MIFIGYGGNDLSIKKMLETIPKDDLRLGVYWVSRTEPQGAIRPWLETRDATWVEKGDFDELMLLNRGTFDLPHPNRARFDEVFGKYKATYDTLSARIVSLSNTAPDASAMKEAVKRADESFPDWWAVTVMAERLKETDPDQTNAIYEKGLTQFPSSAPLIGSYATFLHHIRKDYDRAEEYYKKAIEVDPKHANNLGNYAGFLLSWGNTKEGLLALEKVFPLLNAPGMPSDLAAECWFYAFAHRSAEQRDEALSNLKRILQSGGRSPNWDLAPNIAQARKDGHPDVTWLEKLAAVISDGADIGVLDKWHKWKKA